MRVALLRLNHALDCDSRQSNIIKSLIDRLHEEVLRRPPPPPAGGGWGPPPPPPQPHALVLCPHCLCLCSLATTQILSCELVRSLGRGWVKNC
jgi:hypothetical protein